MNRLPESVNQQFNQLFAAIGQAGDDLKLAIAEAGLMGDFEVASANMAYCQRLQALESELKTCLERFGYSNKSAPTEKTFHHRSKRRTRKPNGLIRVRVAGKIVQEPTITKSFVEVLKIFGLERVAQLNIGPPTRQRLPSTNTVQRLVYYHPRQPSHRR